VRLSFYLLAIRRSIPLATMLAFLLPFGPLHI